MIICINQYQVNGLSSKYCSCQRQQQMVTRILIYSYRISIIIFMIRNLTSVQTDSAYSRVLVVNSQGKSIKVLIEKITRCQREIINKLDELFSLRIIEKLARPMEIQKKILLVNDFQKILKVIHEKMESLEKDFDLNSLGMDKQYQKNEKNKRKLEMNVHAKLSFFNIRKKYSQILVQSSLAHYKKIASVYEIKEEIAIMDVEKWLTNCLHKLERMNTYKQTSSCC